MLADASPLIGLVRIDGLPWLRKLYGTIWLTPVVHRECTARGRRGAAELSAAVRRGWIRKFSPVSNVPALPRLDAGEASVLRAAAGLGDRAIVILDDLAARREARRLGVEFIGTAGIIVEARQRRLIPKARPVFEQLVAEGFYLSAALVEAILSELGED